MATRKPKLDKERFNEVCTIIAVGGSRKLAARYVGCSVDTIRRTAEKDADFAADMVHAESKHELVFLQRISAAANKEQYWRAAAWALERMYPDRYAPRRPLALSPRQFAEVLRNFAEVVTAEVTDLAQRKKVLDRLLELIETIGVDESAPPAKRSTTARKARTTRGAHDAS